MVVTEPGPEYLRPTEFVDSDHPAVVDFARRSCSGGGPRERAVELYYAIRDGFRYSPWGVSEDRSAFRASTVAAREVREAHCIDKANLLAACARALGVPSRLHFANVRNHIGTAAFEEQLGTDLLVFHGYCELYLEGRWVAATPAFNRELCEHLNVTPLEFDGTEDSIFQEYDRQGGLFMEYLHDYGSFADIPYDAIRAAWREHYPEVARRGQWPRRPAGQTS